MVYAELMHAKNVVKYLIMEVSLSFTKELTLVIIHEHVKDVIPKSQTVEVLKFIQNHTEKHGIEVTKTSYVVKQNNN